MLRPAGPPWAFVLSDRYAPGGPSPGEDLWRDLMILFHRVGDGHGTDADRAAVLHIARTMGTPCLELDGPPQTPSAPDTAAAGSTPARGLRPSGREENGE